MSGSYQSDDLSRLTPSGGNGWTGRKAWIGWLALSPLLLWFPAASGPGATWIAPAAAAFHALWFFAGGWLTGHAGRTPGRIAGWLATWMGLVILGAVFELGQGFVPGRDPSWIDGLLNALGAAAGLCLAALRRSH